VIDDLKKGSYGERGGRGEGGLKSGDRKGEMRSLYD